MDTNRDTTAITNSSGFFLETCARNGLSILLVMCVTCFVYVPLTTYLTNWRVDYNCSCLNFVLVAMRVVIAFVIESRHSVLLDVLSVDFQIGQQLDMMDN